MNPTPARTLEPLAVRVLWVTAGVLLALILFRAEPLSGAPPLFGTTQARAGTLGVAGAYTLMTSPASNEDLFLVLDGRAEELSVYRAQNAGGVQLFQRLKLPPAFTEARLRATGRPESK